MTDSFESKNVYVAINKGVIVGVLQYPIQVAKDYHVYLQADTPEENERRKLIRDVLLKSTDKYKSEIKAFLDKYESQGCDIDTGSSSTDWLDFILLTEELCKFPRIGNLPVKILT